MKILANMVAWLTNASGLNNITIDDPVDEGGYLTPTDRFSYGVPVRFKVNDGDAWARYEGVLTNGGAGSDYITRAKFVESSTGSDLNLSNTNGKLCYVEAGAEMLGADRGRLNIAATTGTGAAYLLDLPIPLEQLKDGVEVHFFAHTDNTQSDITLKVNSTDPKPVRRGLPRRKLAVGSVRTDALVTAKYSEAGGGTWNIRAGLVRTVKVIPGTPYNLVEEDHEQMLIFNVAGAVAAAVPQATGQFAGDFWFDYQNMGSGTVTFTPATSTINTLTTLDALTGQSGRWFTVGANYRSTQAAAVRIIRNPRRQTVLSGPVNTDGLPNFGGATGGTTVTMAGTLIAAAANGYDANGAVDRVGLITNASWTGLNTNGTLFLFLDVNADGTCTPGSVTPAPIYQEGGNYSNTNNQFVFNVKEMVGKVGTGAASNQVYRVFVGEVAVSGGVVSAITWYALNGRYLSPYTATLPGTSTAVSFNHNLGTNFIVGSPELQIECTSADAGCAVGDIITRPTANDASLGAVNFNLMLTGRNTMQFATGSAGAFLSIPKAGGGPIATLTAAKWKYRSSVDRGW